MSTQRPIGVGSQTLLHGDKMAGYYGEVNNLITANELRSLTGVTEGTSMQTGDIKFLKYSHNNKTLYVPEKPLQHSISWDHLQSKDLVFGKMIDIKGNLYLVRLMQGSSINPSTNYSGGTPPVSVTGQNSEWDSLLVPSAKTWNVVTEDALGVLEGNGRYNWCQEVHSHGLTTRVVRGSDRVSDFNAISSSNRRTYCGWRPVLELLVGLNASPTIVDNTENNKTLYENDVVIINGNVTDTDNGDVTSVKYKINNGTVRALATGISDGSTPLAYNKSLKYSNKRLYDGSTDISGLLSEGSQNTITIFAEDDKGGKSLEVKKVFYVVHNRPPIIVVNPIEPISNLINTDKITVTGNVNDLDGNNVTVKFKIGNNAFTEIYSGVSSEFAFDVPLLNLVTGNNVITIRAEDSFGAITDSTITVKKTGVEVPLRTAVARYKLTPPNGTAKGIVLWIEREVGDLVVDAEISFGDEGGVENFQPMIKNSTAFVTEGIEEDEFTFDNSTPKANIVVKLTMTRVSTSSTQGITLISGVLS